MSERRDKIAEFVKEKIEDNYYSWQIHEEIADKFGEVSRREVDNIIDEVNNVLQEEIDLSAENIVVSHAHKYEQNYKKIFTKTKRYETKKDRIPYLYMEAIDTLKRKERVLGIVRPNMEIEFESKLIERFTDEPDHPFANINNINLQTLTIAEKKEFLDLLKKARGQDNHVLGQGIVQADEEAQVVEDDEQEEAKFDDVAHSFADDAEEEEKVNQGENSSVYLEKQFKHYHQKEGKELDQKIRRQKALERLKNKTKKK